MGRKQWTANAYALTEKFMKMENVFAGPERNPTMTNAFGVVRQKFFLLHPVVQHAEEMSTMTCPTKRVSHALTVRYKIGHR